MKSPSYTLRIDGRQVENITQISIRFSMRELADSWSASISDRVDLAPGARAELAIEGRTVIVGELQNDRLVKRSGTRDRSISGFSSARRLVKSSVIQPTRTIKDRSLRQIVEQIVEPFDMVVDVSESATTVADEPIDKVKIGPNQNAVDFLNAICKRYGCILVSGAASVDPDRKAKASVRITRVGVRASPIPLVYPGVLAVDYENDVGNVHSSYLVNRKGKGLRDSDGTLRGLDGTATDARVLYSPLIVQAQAGGTSQESLNIQAEMEMRKRAAEGQRVSIEVERWSPNNSQALWWPNTLYRFVDTEEGFDETLLLSSVELTQGSGGASARLELLPPDAFAILSDRELKVGRRTGRGGYRANKEWLAQHSQLVTAIANASDTVDYDKSKQDLIWKPADDA